MTQTDASPIQHGDCIEHMNQLEAGSVPLVFADPPFNIGYKYDQYDDRLENDQYLEWSRRWMTAVHRVLRDDGTFWLAIGDEYAAELKVTACKIGFKLRSWVVWYYTFGVNCKYKFTRSHAHLFYFVKDAENFTFRSEDLDNRIPSARELVYNDRRANPQGRLPDDTWIVRPLGAVGEAILDKDLTWSPEAVEAPADADQTYTLRPQDLGRCFQADEDTWYFPRVAGTFKERAGFHGCQMPEQLLGRIIRTCSNPGDTVLDPFSGSATTLAVAKKLGRKPVGFELSDDYVRYGRERLSTIRVGDRLDGSPEPLKSAPRTDRAKSKRGGKSNVKGRSKDMPLLDAQLQTEKRYEQIQLELTIRGVSEAFALMHDGFSLDRLVADPQLNQQFVDACERLSLVGDARTWNALLFHLRKSGELPQVETTKRTEIAWETCDQYIYASEIALQSMLDAGSADSLDEILCDPALAACFDAAAERLAPGFTPLQYRWAAIQLRQEARDARIRAGVLQCPAKFEQPGTIGDVNLSNLPADPAVYIIHGSNDDALYVGETLDFQARMNRQFAAATVAHWQSYAEQLRLEFLPIEPRTAGRLSWQSCLVRLSPNRPKLNYYELAGL